MRWERFFEDLDAQASEVERAETRAEVADRTRRERAAVSLLDRLAAAPAQLVIEVVTGLRIEGVVLSVGSDWFAIDGQGRRWVVPVSAILSVQGLASGAAPGGASRRHGLGLVLRELSRDRSLVVIHDRAGRAIQGRIDAVGADWVDFVDWAANAGVRSGSAASRRCLPWAQLVAIMSREVPAQVR